MNVRFFFIIMLGVIGYGHAMDTKIELPMRPEHTIKAFRDGINRTIELEEAKYGSSNAIIKKSGMTPELLYYWLRNNNGKLGIVYLNPTFFDGEKLVFSDATEIFVPSAKVLLALQEAFDALSMHVSETIKKINDGERIKLFSNAIFYELYVREKQSTMDTFKEGITAIAKRATTIDKRRSTIFGLGSKKNDYAERKKEENKAQEDIDNVQQEVDLYIKTHEKVKNPVHFDLFEMKKESPRIESPRNSGQTGSVEDTKEDKKKKEKLEKEEKKKAEKEEKEKKKIAKKTNDKKNTTQEGRENNRNSVISGPFLNINETQNQKPLSDVEKQIMDGVILTVSLTSIFTNHPKKLAQDIYTDVKKMIGNEHTIEPQKLLDTIKQALTQHGSQSVAHIGSQAIFLKVMNYGIENGGNALIVKDIINANKNFIAKAPQVANPFYELPENVINH